MECPVCGAYGWRKDEVCEPFAVHGETSSAIAITYECLRCGYETSTICEAAIAQS